MTDDELRELAREAAAELDDIHFNGRSGSWMENAEKIVLAALLKAKEAGERDERERCAKIADGRVVLARTLAPEAAWAVFEALPDAIRQDTGRG